jgi:hypothetical protein
MRYRVIIVMSRVKITSMEMIQCIQIVGKGRSISRKKVSWMLSSMDQRLTWWRFQMGSKTRKNSLIRSRTREKSLLNGSKKR